MFHLAFFVQAGEFIPDRKIPAQSKNVIIFDTGRPLRVGVLRITFTDHATGNTSIFISPSGLAAQSAEFRSGIALCKPAKPQSPTGNDGPQLQVSVPVQDAIAGGMVDVGINAANLANSGALLWNLIYDPAFLALDQVTRQAANGETGLLASNPESFPDLTGRVRIGTLMARGRSGSSPVATLRFRVKSGAQGSTALQLENLLSVDINLKDVNLLGVGATLSISSGLPPGRAHFRSVAFTEPGTVKLTIDTQPGRNYILEVSSDLRAWLPAQTKSAAGATLDFLDADAGSDPARFYRVLNGP